MVAGAMVAGAEVLAIVQARGGSKGVPGKNLRLVDGHPLVTYSIASGLSAKTVTRLIVSTDDAQIAEVSRRYSAEVPFFRPADLATDEAPDFPLFEHALQWLDEHEGYRPRVVVQLRPTTPFRPCGLIDEAVTLLLNDPAADCVRAVTKASQNPYKMWNIKADGYLGPLLACELDEPYNQPRQKLPPTYWQTGHVDAIRYETIVARRSLTGDRIRHILVDERYCVDIDTPLDIELANWMLRSQSLDIDFPGIAGRILNKRPWPRRIGLVVFDFDGVFTDNRVWVSQDGREAVACNRGDGMGLALLLARGVEAAVLSTEANPVVTARCQKLNLPCQQGLADKATALRSLAEQRQIDLENVVYLGNDVNDLASMRLAGFGVAVADSHPETLAQADWVLQTRGGYGAVRELCDLILQKLEGDTVVTKR